MIIVPYAYVTEYNAYKASNPTSDYGYYEYFKNVKGKMVNLTYTPEQVAANPVSGGYQIKGSLVDIKEANLERDFVGIGYVRTSGRAVRFRGIRIKPEKNRDTRTHNKRNR